MTHPVLQRDPEAVFLFRWKECHYIHNFQRTVFILLSTELHLCWLKMLSWPLISVVRTPDEGDINAGLLPRRVTRRVTAGCPAVGEDSWSQMDLCRVTVPKTMAPRASLNLPQTFNQGNLFHEKTHVALRREPQEPQEEAALNIPRLTPSCVNCGLLGVLVASFLWPRHWPEDTGEGTSLGSPGRGFSPTMCASLSS